MGFFEASGFDSRFGHLRDEEVVLLARCGSRGAAECLIARYRTLVEFRARAYFVYGADHDDVVQEGMIGLFEAIRDFRGDLRSGFRPFADMCVTRQIQSAVRASRRQKHLALNASVVLENAEETPSTIDGHDVSMLLAHNVHVLMAAALTDLERSVLDGYAEGRSYREMSEHLNRPAKAIDNALQRAKRKLAQAIGDAGMVA
ncbi:MAG TPA: sigma-70 family RNA polymerase sigma factor [Fimbriimonadaceae bacterium]|nr:sigma-70 family RNA polymerase sigma factor [Fimbriimonadaceae bacterium]HRJ97462.1 sigma-70 family RNA polymerase sigma factor [Fimbriimonadaceae bacterium]